jgi:hypothetical protein
MSLVWERSAASGAELLVLLALADFADEDGKNIYPSHGTLALKARQSERNISRLLSKLRDRGEIDWRTRAKKGNHGAVNVYWIRLAAFAVPDRMSATSSGHSEQVPDKMSATVPDIPGKGSGQMGRGFRTSRVEVPDTAMSDDPSGSVKDPPEIRQDVDDSREDELPIAVREMRELVLMKLPGRMRHDALTIDEATSFARDFAGQVTEFNAAVAAIRREGTGLPFPARLRAHMPVLAPGGEKWWA